MNIKYIVSDTSSFFGWFEEYKKAIEEAKKRDATVTVEATIGNEHYQVYEEEIYCNGELMSKSEVDELIREWQAMEDGRCTP